MMVFKINKDESYKKGEARYAFGPDPFSSCNCGFGCPDGFGCCYEENEESEQDKVEGEW